VIQSTDEAVVNDILTTDWPSILTQNDDKGHLHRLDLRLRNNASRYSNAFQLAFIPSAAAAAAD